MHNAPWTKVGPLTSRISTTAATDRASRTIASAVITLPCYVCMHMVATHSLLTPDDQMKYLVTPSNSNQIFHLIIRC